MDVDNLPSSVFLSPVQPPPPSNDGKFMLELKSDVLNCSAVPARITIDPTL